MKRYYVEVEDWGVRWACKCHEHMSDGHFKAESGYVWSGPVTPLFTNFQSLTAEQRAVMAAENAYVRALYATARNDCA